MIDGKFREILPTYSKYLISLCRHLGLTPNQLSLLSLGLAIIAAILVANAWIWFAIGFWWLGRLLDGTDGIYARETNQTSHFGAYLDLCCDMASYSLMIIGFSFLYPELSLQWNIMLFLYVLCVTSALTFGALEEKLNLQSQDNRGIRLAAGLAEGGETGIAYTLFLLMPQNIFWLTHLWIVILALTVIIRSVLAKKTFAPLDRKTKL
jgi:phosphatidylglycerophosphate synthase